MMATPEEVLKALCGAHGDMVARGAVIDALQKAIRERDEAKALLFDTLSRRGHLWPSDLQNRAHEWLQEYRFANSAGEDGGRGWRAMSERRSWMKPSNDGEWIADDHEACVAALRAEIERLKEFQRAKEKTVEGLKAELDEAESTLAAMRAKVTQPCATIGARQRCTALEQIEAKARNEAALRTEVEYWHSLAEGQRAEIAQLERERDEMKGELLRVLTLVQRAHVSSFVAAELDRIRRGLSEDEGRDTECPRRDPMCDPACAEWSKGERSCTALTEGEGGDDG
jgi:hypothetical protein